MHDDTDRIEIELKPAGLPVPVQTLKIRKGQSLEDIALSLYGTDVGIRPYLRSSGPTERFLPVPREMWSRIRPKADRAVRFSYRPAGGGKGNVFAIVAAIALAVIAPYLGSVIAPLLGFAATGLAASLIGAGIAIGGSLLLAQLFPADQTNRLGREDSGESDVYEDVSADGNLLGRSAYPPVVVGSMRVSPPDLVNPRPYLEDGIQSYEKLLGFSGKHLISNIRVDGTPIGDFPAITSETKDGDEATGTSTFVDTISNTTFVNEALSTFSLDETVLEDQNNPENSEPLWLQFVTPGHEKLKEIVLRFRLDGFVKSDGPTTEVRMPVRLQFRPKGGGEGDWVSIPEIHFIGRSQTALIVEFRFRWDNEFNDFTSASEITFQFYQEVPGVTASALSDGSTGAQWRSHYHFIGTSQSPAPIYDVQNITFRRRSVQVQLDEDLFAKGDFEWRVKRGIVTSTFQSSDYTISSTVESLFLGRTVSSQWAVPVDQGSFPAQLTLLHATAIADEQPVQWPETALIAMRSKGQSIRNVTCEAARYVFDYEGAASPSGWITETAASKNPATHYRQVLYDYLVFHGIDTALIDEQAFIDWRQECIDRGYECSAVFAGETVSEVLDSIAAAGFAKKTFSDKFSVEWFRDRSSEIPVQTFSPRNTSSIGASIVVPERSVGYRVTFLDEDDDYRENEIEVAIDNASDIQNWEAISYKAITNTDLVRRRAYFDLLQITKRRRQWKVETALEGVVCEIGNLVSVVSDLFDDDSHGARIRSVTDSTHIVIDQVIPATNTGLFGESPNPVIDDVLLVGEQSRIFISTPTGVEECNITGVDGTELTISPALSTLDVVGAHVNIAALSNSTHRCIVVGIDRKDEERAVLTLVDEAPEIWTTMQERFG